MPRLQPIYLELGQKWVFACALDWPGWCRRGKDEEAAVQALLAYAQRYRAVAGSGFPVSDVEIVGHLEGNATTDFGAPSAIGPWDEEPLGGQDARRQLAVLEASWRAFDEIAGGAPSELRKGPRGGGRDRDGIARHVQEAERSYAAKVGARVPPRTPWKDQRTSLVDALSSPAGEPKWPVRYALRRIAWHVLDHAWEIEDRSS
jgi:hypothetical protein